MMRRITSLPTGGRSDAEHGIHCRCCADERFIPSCEEFVREDGWSQRGRMDGERQINDGRHHEGEEEEMLNGEEGERGRR